MKHKPLQLLLLAASLSALTLCADSDLVIQSFNGSGNITWSHNVNTGVHRIEWASSLAGPWQSTWKNLVGIPANGGVSQASVPMFYRVIWCDDRQPFHTVTTNMIQYVYEDQTMRVSGEFQGLTTATDHYFGSLAHVPIIASSLTISIGSNYFYDDGCGTLTGGNGGTIHYGTGAWTVQMAGMPSSGTQILATYLYAMTVPILLPEITVAGEHLGVSVSGVTKYAGVLENVTVQDGSLTICMGDRVFYDTGTGLLVATGGSNGTINYDTGLWRLSIVGAVLPDLPLTASYRSIEKPPDGETSILTEATVVDEAQGLTTSASGYGGILYQRPILAGSVIISANGYVFTDDGCGRFIGQGGGTINYATGAWTISLIELPLSGLPIRASYTYLKSSIMPQQPPARILNEPAGQGIADCTSYVGKLAHTPIPGSFSIVTGGYGFDEGANGALLSPYGTGTVYHATAVWIISFPAAVLQDGEPIKATYKHW